jgi:hypothetical protein
MLLGMAFRVAQEDRYGRELVMNAAPAWWQAKTADMRFWGTRQAGRPAQQRLKPGPRVRAAR